MRLSQTAAYTAYGLSQEAQDRLARLGDLLLGAASNVTSVGDPEELEKIHFLDSLSLLTLDPIRCSARTADLGSGGGLPALVLALALPDAQITAIESQRKKCEHIERTATALGIRNVIVRCERAEDHARTGGRNAYDVVVSRAVAALPVIAEYSLPLLRLDGDMVAMKGLISDEERTQASCALDILGGGRLEAIRMQPFGGARDRWVYLARKIREAPEEYPRRAGLPAKRPLGRRMPTRGAGPAL